MWTEEMLALMFASRARRFRRLRQENGATGAVREVSDTELFESMGVKPTVVRRKA